MNLDTCVEPDPRLTAQDPLAKILSSAVEVPATTFDDLEFRSKITLLDHPCGFGKTSSLLSVINNRPDLKFLVVVNTLDEVDRIMRGVTPGRMSAPKDAFEANANKGEQLEALLVASKSVVITHKLYEKAGRLADGGLLRDYSVIIDEVPNTIKAPAEGILMTLSLDLLQRIVVYLVKLIGSQILHEELTTIVIVPI